MFCAAVAIILALPGTGLSQSTLWEASLTGGYMTPNNFNMPEYSAWTLGGDVAWWYRFEGDEWWVARRKNPLFGVKASFAYIPQSMSGHRIGIEGIVRAPLKGRLDYHFGVGLSAYTRSKYFTHDEDNIFITTLVSCLIDVGVDYRFTDRLSATFALLHSSNGLLNRPNKGLNYLQLGLGYSIGGVKTNTLSVQQIPQPEFGRTELNVAFQGGMAMSRDLNVEGYFPCYDLSINYQVYLDPVVALGGTVDFWYNCAHTEVMKFYKMEYPMPCYLSSLVYLEGFWGPLSLKGGIGPVLLASPCVNIKFYERVGVYYNFGNNYVGVALNAHAGMIEFIELCYGIRMRGN